MHLVISRDKVVVDFDLFISTQPMPEQAQIPTRKITAMVYPAAQKPEPTVQIKSVHVSAANRLFDFARWVSNHNAPRFHVPHRYRPCTNNRSFTDCNARPHERIRTNPSVGADRNRRTLQRKIRFGVIVSSCADMRAV